MDDCGAADNDAALLSVSGLGDEVVKSDVSLLDGDVASTEGILVFDGDLAGTAGAAGTAIFDGDVVGVTGIRVLDNDAEVP